MTNEVTLWVPVPDSNQLKPDDQALHLLCVEDNPTDQQLLVRILKRSGLRVTVDTVDELEVFRERLRQGDYDMITCDFKLNNWTAFDALDILRDSGKDIPLIVVSGNLGDEAAVDCIKRGATDYVLKDRMARLPSAIQRALEAKSVRDEERRTKSALLQSAEQYRMLFEGNPNPMWVFDAENKAILAVNHAAIRAYGYSSEEFLDMTISDLWILEEIDPYQGALAASPDPVGQIGPIDLKKHRTKGGEVIDVEVTASPLHFRGRSARLHQAVDVTEKNSLQAQLLQSQKMESLGRLAGGVAHDLNNLLSVVLGYGEITLAALNSTSELRHNLEQIQKAGDSAASVVRQLLAFSRKQIQQTQILNLGQIVRDMEKLLRPLIGENILLSVTTESNLGSVKADLGQIEQIIMNLVVNARDAMPRGGQLTIRTANIESSEVEPHGLEGPSGLRVMLEVSDSGAGMDAATRARIFEPFFTTKGPGEGTGLGLATVYGIVEQSGGSITVHSELGHGATFRICFPRLEAAAQTINEDKQAQAMPGGSETILLVEDAEPIRRVARRFLCDAGYAVLQAEDSTTALAAAREHTGPIHLLLTDVMLPGLNGPQLAQELCASYPHLPVLYMSGYTDEALGQHGVLKEGIFLLEKPFTRGALLRKLRELLDVRDTSRSGETR